MAAEVAAYPDALLDHIEGVGVNVVQRHLHRRQFVLVQADAHHMHLLVGIAAPALPQGKAAVQLLQDGLVQPLGILLGEDDHLDGDILLVQAIQEQGLEHLIIITHASTIHDAHEWIDGTVVTDNHIILNIGEWIYLAVVSNLSLWRDLCLWTDYTCHNNLTFYI